MSSQPPVPSPETTGESDFAQPNGAEQFSPLAAEVQQTLARELRLALLSEFGARAICDHLGRWVTDSALRESLERVNREGTEVVHEIQDLLRLMGVEPRRTSLRRRVLARVLALMARVTGPRPVVRVAMEACATLARWYQQYSIYLLQNGEPKLAQRCERLAEIKQRHAASLGAWTHHR